MAFFPTAAAWPIALALAGSAPVEQTTIAPADNSSAAATSRIVGGILSYSYWPTHRDPVRLCITGRSRRTGQLANTMLVNGATVTTSRLAPAAVTADACDALYIAMVSPTDRARLINRLGNTAVVTMTDDDPACEFGAMFCLRRTPEGMRFDLNIGAVARSRVRIDPRVLALSRASVAEP